MMANASQARVEWVDYAKGFCIVMVVTMHSTFGVEAALGREGFMNAVVAFARPFRMPDFFLISGLFLARVIDRDWRSFIDRKVVHFAYFYVLWVTIQFAFKAPAFAAERGPAGVAWLYAESFVEPFGTLWFIYLLPIFFCVSKLARDWRVPPVAMWMVGAALEIAPIATGWTVIDEFAGRFVYFYTGYVCAPAIFAFAAHVQSRIAVALCGLGVWSMLNGMMVFGGVSELPALSLGLGFVGAAAIVALSALLAKTDVCRPLRYCGEQSLPIYLGFFLPMAATRIALAKTGLIADPGVVAIIVTTAAVLGALVIYWIATRIPYARLLYRRPLFLHLGLRPRATLQPAE